MWRLLRFVLHDALSKPQQRLVKQRNFNYVGPQCGNVWFSMKLGLASPYVHVYEEL